MRKGRTDPRTRHVGPLSSLIPESDGRCLKFSSLDCEDTQDAPRHRSGLWRTSENSILRRMSARQYVLGGDVLVMFW